MLKVDHSLIYDVVFCFKLIVINSIIILYLVFEKRYFNKIHKVQYMCHYKSYLKNPVEEITHLRLLIPQLLVVFQKDRIFMFYV